MRSWIIAFMIVAAVFALLAIAYVVMDLILELRQRVKNAKSIQEEDAPEREAGAVNPKD